MLDFIVIPFELNVFKNCMLLCFWSLKSLLYTTKTFEYFIMKRTNNKKKHETLQKKTKKKEKILEKSRQNQKFYVAAPCYSGF